MERYVNGIWVQEKGDPSGPAVVLVHAFPLDCTMWESQVEALAATHRVVTYDVRGHGRSAVGDGQYSIELFVDDLVNVLDALQIDSAVFCGLSMGGYIVLRLAERHPSRVRALVLCDTRSEADTDEAKVKRAAAAKSVKIGGSAAFAAGFVTGALCGKTLEHQPQTVDRVSRMIRGNQPLAIAGTALALGGRTDTTEALKRMEFPVLILVGEHDRLTPPASAEAMRVRLPRAGLQVIPDAGHLPNLENPLIFNRKLLDFLEALVA